MRTGLIIFTIILGFSACTYDGTFREVQTDGTFSISFPDYMKEVDDLMPDAVLQYSNPYRNTYAIVLRDEKKTVDFWEYQQAAVNVLKNYELLENPITIDSTYTETSFGQVADLHLYGLMQEENIYYWHSTYESNSYYFQVVVWTRSMDRKQRYGPDIEKIIESFTPLE